MAAPGYTVRLDRFQIQVISIDAADKLIRRVTKEVQDGAEAILSFGPYTTGRLLTGLQTQIRYGPYVVEGRVGISGKRFPYAASVEGGAKRHKIPLLPKPYGRSLRFYWRKVGHIVHFQQVNHPGQTGKAYLRIPILVVAPKYNMRVFTYD
jgi:hypothetical protein